MPALDALPRKFGPYRILEKIGEGGMGVVYLARDAANRQVAIKVLGPAVAADPAARLRLAREVETMRRVSNAHVAAVLDADLNGPSPYVVTRYVPGQTLEAAVRQHGPLRGAALQRLASGLAEALAAIHAAGVIHRDLKPGNVMLDDGQPVVIDFGIAHIQDSTRLTKTGLVMGTPGYLSPEIIEGKQASGASDVHSWGTTMAYAATGRQPYGTGDFQTVFYRVLAGRPELTGVPPALLPLVSAALSTDPLARPTARSLVSLCAASAANGTSAPYGTARLPNGAQPTLTGAGGGSAVPMPPVVPPRPSAAPAYRRPDWPEYRSPAQAAQDVIDLLPPVDYARPGGRPDRRPQGQSLGTQQTQSPGTGRPQGPAAPRPPAPPPAAGHGLIGLAAVVSAIGISLLLPVAGTILALGVITLLRAADTAQVSLSDRRSVRGARPSDILLVIITAPWTVARALLKTVLLAPLALVVAVPAAIAAVVLARAGTLPAALSWGAAAAVAFYCVGPGSGKPRRQLRRMSAAVIRSRGAMIAACISAVALALAILSSALSQPPLIWPATASTIPHLLPTVNMLPSLGGTLHAVQRWLLAHSVGMLHLP
ncbi:MAG: serine/threonine-protein kinase [Trebonia sp.]|jgi:serine/threonine protein kinase